VLQSWHRTVCFVLHTWQLCNIVGNSVT